MLTGSQADGTAFAAGDDRTCKNWTSSTQGAAMVGHSDRKGLRDDDASKSWNTSHPSRGPDGGSNINVPNTGALGLPVRIDDGSQVRSVDFRVTYDPGLLNITGARGNGLRADDGNSTFTNSGTILVQGSDAFGVYMQGSNNRLTNSGTIRATGNNADGVVSNTVSGTFTSLIENTGVGHGWVEGGALYPAHEEIYMQGVWVEALRGLGELADVMNDQGLAADVRATVKRVQDAVERVYWLQDRGFYAFATAQPRKSPATAEPGPRRDVRQKTPANRLGLKAHRRALGFRRTCAPSRAVLALRAASGDGRPMRRGICI